MRVMNPTKDPLVLRCTVCSEKTTIEKKTEEPKAEKPAKAVARGPWGVADLKKLNKKHPSAPLKAIIALLTRGPDRLDGADLKAIVGLEEYLDGK
jgi:hypothetical protein